MKKAELVASVAAKTGMTKKDSEKAVTAFVESVKEELAQKGKVQIMGFGTFETRERKARVGVNMQTKEPMDIPASTAAVFRAGKSLKDIVNKKVAKPAKVEAPKVAAKKSSKK